MTHHVYLGGQWGGGFPHLSSQENTSCMFASKKGTCRDASVGKQIRKKFIWGKLHLHHSCLQYLSSLQAVLNHLLVLHFSALPAASAHATHFFFTNFLSLLTTPPPRRQIPGCVTPDTGSSSFNFLTCTVANNGSNSLR